MKMFALGFIAILGFAIPSFAQPAKVVSNKYSFVLNSHADVGSEVYFNCDSVESTAKEMLHTMGARNIEVRCTGGISDTMPATDAVVSVNYDSLKAVSVNDATTVAGVYAHVVLRSNEDCVLGEQLFNKFAPTFEIKDLTPARRCTPMNDSYTYSFNVLE